MGAEAHDRADSLLLGAARGAARWAARQSSTGLVLAGAGLLQPATLAALVRAAPSLARAGLSPAGAYAYAATRSPEELAVVDDEASWTFAEMYERVEVLAEALADHGVRGGDRVGILCRNHRFFLESTAAFSRLGCDIVLLHTSFAAPQVAEVVRQQEIWHLVVDEELLGVAGEVPGRRFLAWGDRSTEAGGADLLTLGQLDGGPRLGGRSLARVAAPVRSSRYVLLTSGTTGSPRQAVRPVPHTVEPMVGALARVPLRVGGTMLIATPLFHALGFGHFALSLVLSSTVVLERHFDPEPTLAAIERHRVGVLVAVPLMVQRLAELPADVRRRYDTSSLEVVICAGSALRADLAGRFMDAYGDVLYNVYGSTEAAWATIARPRDLRAAPGTVGRPVQGTDVRVVDDAGSEVTPGSTGHIVVRSGLSVPGGSSEPDGFVRTGDLGHVDGRGRLFVEGREDDMIVSGGENVYPEPVEAVLASHPAVEDAAVVGVPDPEYGERVRALVVVRPGHDLDHDELRRFLRDRLPGYAVPRELVVTGELPRNELGKTLRRRLRD